MSHESTQTLSDPVYGIKMPLFDGTMASTGLSRPQALPGFLGKQSVPYNGAYFAYEPRVKDREGFTPPWSHAKTSPLDDRVPVSHLSGMGQNHLVYRKDSISADRAHSHSSAGHTTGKKGFTAYSKSPEISSPTAASSVVIRKPKVGGEISPSPSQLPVYLAIPKPVYGLNPCCNELGCVMGQRFSVEHISPRMPSSVYEQEWMHANGHYSEKASIQRNDALLQQKNLQLECSTAEMCGPSRARTLPSVLEPSYRNYPCTPTRTLFGSLREASSQPLQTSPSGYPGLYTSRPTYEHMTSEVYQECSPMSKYGQLTQHPAYFYSQADGEVERITQRKDSRVKQGEDGALLQKHSIVGPREHYVAPQTHHAEIPLSCTEILPDHSFIRGLDYPCYAVPRFHLNASQIRGPLKRQHILTAIRPSGMSVSPSSQCVDTPRDVNQLHSSSSSFICFDKNSPSGRANQASASPSSAQVGRFFQPLSSLHVDTSVIPPSPLNANFAQEQSPCEGLVKQQRSLPVSPAAWLPRSPTHCPDRLYAAVAGNANVRKIIFSPATTAGSNHNGLVSETGNTDCKKGLKRSISHSSSPVKIKEEDRDVYEVACTNKRRRRETVSAADGKNDDSPPMPVIDNVFSLAPYQSRSEVCAESPKPTQVAELDKVELNHKDQTDPVVCVESRESDLGAIPGKTSDATKELKVEKPNTSNKESGETETSHSKVTIKTESEDTSSSDTEHVPLQNKGLSGEPEEKLLFANENAASGELKPAVLPVKVNPAPPDKPPHTQTFSLQPKSVPLQPLANKVSFKSIPAHCLKLSTYNIIVPNNKHCRTVPSPGEQLSSRQDAAYLSKQELHTPVRKHFLELHQSLCSLISKCVSVSSQKELKNWLSGLEISQAGSQSSKVQKVSCLLGAKAREEWMDDKIRSALREVLDRLQEYTALKRCPFPHVMRTGAVFLPMLVVKELLFPTVQGSFIDKVLHEHKVELRPTTLSEEKILIQLHKRACSSRLRRLMSLKHLPEIYAEAVSLLYYTCVCKKLELKPDKAGPSDVSNTSAPVFLDVAASPASPSDLHHPTCVKVEEAQAAAGGSKTKSRVSNRSRRMFLDKEAAAAEAGNGGSLNDKDTGCVASGWDSSENSWTCPLMSPSPDDTETELLSDPGSRVKSKHCSGMILKLRKMLGRGLNKKKACYQTVPGPSTHQADGEGAGGEPKRHRKAKVIHRWKGTRGFSRAGRPLSSPPKGKHKPLLKIKYCPYLSACHSAEQRRHWVLRSAVQRARRALRFYYPELVGKRIRHLYEEDDKSEVWYRGEVLRVHEAHANPLKTIFEVRYDSEPEWKYYLELLIDYKKGWLKIED